MKLNAKIYKTLTNAVEVQEIDGKEVEIHFMNNTPYLSRFAGRGNFVVWTSDGTGFKLLVERDYYNELKELHSGKTNSLWISFYEQIAAVRKGLFMKIMLPMIAILLGLLIAVSRIEALAQYQTPILIGALVVMLGFNMLQTNLLKKSVDRIRGETITNIKDYLGEEKFNELVQKQNNFYENYFKFEEKAIPEVEEIQEIKEVKEIEEIKEVEKVEEIKEATKTEVNYSSLLVADLKELAKEKGIKGYNALKKAELVEALKELDKKE